MNRFFVVFVPRSWKITKINCIVYLVRRRAVDVDVTPQKKMKLQGSYKASAGGSPTLKENMDNQAAKEDISAVSRVDAVKGKTFKKGKRILTKNATDSSSDMNIVKDGLDLARSSFLLRHFGCTGEK